MLRHERFTLLPDTLYILFVVDLFYELNSFSCVCGDEMIVNNDGGHECTVTDKSTLLLFAARSSRMRDAFSILTVTANTIFFL